MLERISDFRRQLRAAVAERQAPFAHGTAYFCDSCPAVYDANYLAVESVTTAAEHAAEADVLMERFFHRKVVVDDGGTAVAGEFAALGWSVSEHLVMEHVREPDRRVDTSMVREVAFEALGSIRTGVTLAESYGTRRLAGQLNDVKRRVIAAVPTRFFAAYVNGEIGAYCELRSDGAVAQIEDVNTLQLFRGRGLGRAVVQHALDEGRRGNETVFLEALADDWPWELYAKLGFDTVAERHLFLVPAPQLTGLRLRTPRLELRLPTRADLRALAELAREGVHDPAEMPFEVAWTDNADQPSFVEDVIAYHESKLRSWQPDDWRLELVAFVDGRPVGVQGLNAERFAETCAVSSGSWLGRAWQGRGLGTEMRAAILSLAFDGLGAQVARSGALDGNEQSLGVSRKLGYVETGVHYVSPRGTPVPHVDLELRREDFRSPVPVEIEGLEGLRSLFRSDRLGPWDS